MTGLLKSLFKLPRRTEGLAAHLSKSQQSGARVLFVASNRIPSNKSDKRCAAGGSVVDADYLMTSQDDVDSVYYLESVPEQFRARNAFFIGLGAIRQYHASSGEVRPIYN